MRKNNSLLDNVKKIPVLLYLSDLQSKILRHICTTVNPTYRTLIEEVGKDRITILQSIESLIEHRYIVKQKANPNYEKSKLSFAPTHKGISYACLELKVDLKDIINSSDDEIGRYFKFVSETIHYSQLRKQILEPIFSKLERGYLEFEEDNTAKKKELIKDCFYVGLLQSAQSRSYNAHILFSNNSSKKWNETFSIEELREFKKGLMQAGNNLIKTSERIPA